MRRDPTAPVLLRPELALALPLGVAAALVALRGPTVTAAALALVLIAVVVFRDPRVGVFGMLVALPLDIYGRVGPVTVYQVFLLLTLIAWAWQALTRAAPQTRLGPVDYWLFALLGAALWSLPFSFSQPTTTVSIGRLVFLVALFRLIATYTYGDRGLARRIAAVLMLTAVAAALLATLQHFLPGFEIGNTAVRLGTGQAPVIRGSGFFDDPNYLGGLLSAALVSGVTISLWERSPKGAFPWLIGSAISAVGLYATLSRTAWVGAALGIVLAVALAPRARRRYAAYALLATGATVLMLKPDLLLERVRSITSIGGDASIATRWYMFASAWEMVKDNWATGVGLSAFGNAYPQYRQLGTLLGVVKPHQLPIAVWAEMGIAGLIAEVGLTVAFFRLVVRGWKAGLSVESRFAIAVLATLIVQTLFQYFLFFEYLWLFLAIAVAAIGRDIESKEALA